jgi:nucleotide-binding universal stress UspA family protein
MNASMTPARYFIPVDFSEASFRALQYARMLAARTGGEVRLGHVMDAGDVVESDNPVIVQWSLDRLEQRVNNKMQSLRELISGGGVAVSTEIAFGNVRNGLLKMVERFSPDVIVLARKASGSRKTDIFTYLSKNCRQPLLVVPDSFVPNEPERAVVATDMKPTNGELAALFQLLPDSFRELALLNVAGSNSNAAVEKTEWIKVLEAKYGITAKLLQQRHENIVHGVMDFVKSNPVDLLCTIRRNKNILARTLGNSVSEELARQAEIPVLVICE